jgi:hypothetical protein
MIGGNTFDLEDRLDDQAALAILRQSQSASKH